MTDSIRKDAGLTRQGAALINEVIRTEVPYGRLRYGFWGRRA